MKTILTSFSFLFLLTLNYSFAPLSIAKDDDGVPPDFGSRETTLLIMKLEKMNAQNKKISEIFSKYYKGKFKMIESLDESYADTDKFGYVLMTRATFNPASGMGATRMPASWAYTGSIVDRVADKTYPVGYEGGAYGPFFKAYAKRIEKMRAKNSGQ
jgi:hypothetical protein